MGEDRIKTIINGNTALGIELGSTRIKAVLVDESSQLLALGTHDWENCLNNNIWTYSLDAVWGGIQSCYQSLAEDVKAKYGVELTIIGSLGISAMMHGYMAFNKEDELLVPFRTWRNTMTEQSSRILTEAFQFNIPQRWSISHLYQGILNEESHVFEINYITTLAGYVHYMLTGEKVLGVGDASGMFPIDSKTCDYNKKMIAAFDKLVADKDFSWRLEEILPKVLSAGEEAGSLSETGAKLLDPTGVLKPGILLCPPEGDAGTGMVATNAVAVGTGNVSAGTSIFAMVVMEKELSKLHEEIDMVTTPDGNAVAMVHCNNCTSDLNSWVNLFKEFAENFGMKVDMNDLFASLYTKALEGNADCGGLMSYNYFSGEPITGFEEGRPLFLRTPDSKFNLANFMRTHLYSSLATLKIGLDILLKEEKVEVESVVGHGGLFKTPIVGQRMMAAAMNTPVTVMETASEGGAWGIAVLANYLKNKEKEEKLGEYLDKKIFADIKETTILPIVEDVEGFDKFIRKYILCLPAERGAVDNLC